MPQPYYQSPYTPMYNAQQFIQPQMPRMDQQYVPMQQPTQPQPQVQTYNKPVGLQGKSVDSIDVVKAMDIPLDGSISYFPLTDGSAIVTKQLQTDGTSKTVVYKPVDTANNEKKLNYVTAEEFEKKIKEIDVKEEIKDIKKQLKSLNNDVRDLTEEVK